MKKIKSYTGIWNVEKVLYAINDFNLPFPVTFTQITWFVITEFLIILFGDIPPLSMIEGAFLKYFGIPVALTWFSPFILSVTVSPCDSLSIPLSIGEIFNITFRFDK